MNESSSHYAGLSGRIAVVTGASGAIGGAVCRALARRGAAVAASGRSADALAHLVSEIRSQGGTAVAVAADQRQAVIMFDNLHRVGMKSSLP